MLALGALFLIIGGARAGLSPTDTSLLRAPNGDTTAQHALVSPADSTRPRPKVIELSDWYYRRLTIHRWVAYATVPVFVAQYEAGVQLYDKSRDAPTWAKTTHRVGATMLVGMFTVNTVTGAWNWWDSRSVPQNRVLRTIHAISLLGADAAFSYTGAQLANQAENSAAKRREHRTVALYSMGVTVASALMMKIWNR